jgi:hypothetical protein
LLRFVVSLRRSWRSVTLTEVFNGFLQFTRTSDILIFYLDFLGPCRTSNTQAEVSRDFPISSRTSNILSEGIRRFPQSPRRLHILTELIGEFPQSLEINVVLIS